MWFPHRAFQCLMITSVEILSHDARLLLVSWTETDNMFFLCTVAPTGWNTSLQKSRNSCTPKFQHRTVPTRFPQQFQCGFSWPPSSPDLYPSDYPPPPRGYLKDRSAPWNLTELKEWVTDSCARVTRVMLARTVQNFVLRPQELGDHIENVIHKATHT